MPWRLRHLTFVLAFAINVPASFADDMAPSDTKDVLFRPDAYFAASNTVRLQGVVVWNNGRSKFVLRDSSGALLVMNKTSCTPAAGDRVDVRCNTFLDETGERFLDAAKVVICEHGKEPLPDVCRLEDVRRGRRNYRLVRTSGIVTDVFQDEIDPTTDWMVLRSSDGEIMVSFAFKDLFNERLDSLLDAEVSVTGICLPIDMGRRRFLHPRVEPSGPDSLAVIRPAPEDPFDVEPLDFFPQRHADRPLHRCRTTGTVIATWQGSRLLLRTDDGRNFRVRLRNEEHLPDVDSRITISGFVEFDSFYPEFVQALVRSEPDATRSIESPVELTIRQLYYDRNGKRRIDAVHNDRFVRLEGFVRNIPDPNDVSRRLHLEDDGLLLAVDLGENIKTPSDLSIGCRARISGICLIETERAGEMSGFTRISGISLVPRSSSDIVTVTRPHGRTTVMLLTVISVLVSILIAVLFWNATLRRLAERRGRALFKAEIAKASSDLRIAERTRLAVELHDSLSQNLTGISLQLDLLERLIRPTGDKVTHVLGILSNMLASSRNELRSCIWDLRNQALDEPSLGCAIQRTLKPHLGDTRLSVRFNVARAGLSDNTAHTILRIIRELVTNAIRHGQATSIRIAGSIDGNRLLFSVRDDGSGFDADTVPGAEQGHFGLDGIRERVRHFNGSLTISSARGKGAKVTVVIGMPGVRHEREAVNA